MSDAEGAFQPPEDKKAEVIYNCVIKRLLCLPGGSCYCADGLALSDKPQVQMQLRSPMAGLVGAAGWPCANVTQSCENFTQHCAEVIQLCAKAASTGPQTPASVSPWAPLGWPVWVHPPCPGRGGWCTALGTAQCGTGNLSFLGQEEQQGSGHVPACAALFRHAETVGDE